MRAPVAGWMRGAAAVACPVLLGLAALTLVAASPKAQGASPPSSRVALVIGEGAYRVGPLPAAPDDAGLVAQVLAGAGFDVTGARDLDGDGLRRAFRDFLDRAGAIGPDGIAIVYFAGRAIQADGDNFIVPTDARLARPSDVPIEALRLADLTHALAALPIQARIVIVDGAYAGSATSRASGPSGLALVDAERGELLAFNAAPGTVAPPTSGPYGAYAQALAAAMRQGGVPVGEVFDRVRLAVNGATGGAVVPWDSDRLTRSFTFFDLAPGAPAAASAQIPFAALEKRPLRDFPPDQAYDLAVVRDSLPAYAAFLATFPGTSLARRVRLIQAVRREALVWRAVVLDATPGAYWTYLARYPKGPHAGDARRRLSRLSATAAPPARFVPLGLDVPPAAADDTAFDGPMPFDAPDLPPPPPVPVFLLPPPVVDVLERPPPSGPLFLPVPVPVALPFVRAPLEPGMISPPRGVPGDYPRPRPFGRGPNGDGLVIRSVPPASQPASPAVQPAPPPARSPSASPAQTAPDGRQAQAPQPTVPTVPSTAVPVPLRSPAPRPPHVPAIPGGGSLPEPTLPGKPTPPTAPATAAPPAAPTLPAAPTGRPSQVAPARIAPPAGHAPPPRPADPGQTPRPAPASAATSPNGGPAHRPPRPGAPPLAAPIPPAAPPASALPTRSLPGTRPPPVQVGPAPKPAPFQVSPAAAQPAPAKPAPTPRPPVSQNPPEPQRQAIRPAAPDRLGPGAAPGGHRPACGPPGAPPCRP